MKRSFYYRRVDLQPILSAHVPGTPICSGQHQCSTTKNRSPPRTFVSDYFKTEISITVKQHWLQNWRVVVNFRFFTWNFSSIVPCPPAELAKLSSSVYDSLSCTMRFCLWKVLDVFQSAPVMSFCRQLQLPLRSWRYGRINLQSERWHISPRNI